MRSLVVFLACSQLLLQAHSGNSLPVAARSLNETIKHFNKLVAEAQVSDARRQHACISNINESVSHRLNMKQRSTLLRRSSLVSIRLKSS